MIWQVRQVQVLEPFACKTRLRQQFFDNGSGHVG